MKDEGTGVLPDRAASCPKICYQGCHSGRRYNTRFMLLETVIILPAKMATVGDRSSWDDVEACFGLFCLFWPVLARFGMFCFLFFVLFFFILRRMGKNKA